ncbi:hypothetical protein [uncultured Dysosmobacter sp.]|uniref:hypothetical protein n=1 Tax=uncultured Dysosmobacter sp. TaxID=2591384 RepID=UPI00262EFAEF|nr:hypothetical protein [uncultured Dysosmobacter sp.]
MLDKTNRKILEYMNANGECPSKRFYDFDEDLKKIADKIGTDKETVRAAVRSLNAGNYIIYTCDQHGRPLRFSLDHKGLHYRELQRLDTAAFLKKSILTPIVVTILTTAALHGIPELLRLIAKWAAENPAL